MSKSCHAAACSILAWLCCATAVSVYDTVMMGLVHKAHPDGCRHDYTFLPRLWPYLVRGHQLLYLLRLSACLRLSPACNEPSCNSLLAMRHMTNRGDSSRVSAWQCKAHVLTCTAAETVSCNECDPTLQLALFRSSLKHVYVGNANAC